MNSMTPSQPASTGLSGYQKWVVALLAFLQFTVILDFMIISPLGAILMPLSLCRRVQPRCRAWRPRPRQRNATGI